MSLIEHALEKMRRGGATQGLKADQGGPRGPAGTSAAAHADAKSDARDPQVKRMAVDWERVRAAGYLPEASEARRFADYYRQIKRPLIDKALAADTAIDRRLILLTSALPGDGKTFTAVNLALSMARERDVSVLLVDADVPRSRVSELFGLRGEPGLVDALADESQDVESWVVRTDVDGLDVLPAGETVENATELLASARMSQIASRLLTRNPRRLVLFDSAPILGSSEGRALVAIPGQIVLVVRAGSTPRQAVLDAIAHLDADRFQGLVLNEALSARGSGYYYGYSSYGSAGKETANAG